VAVTASLTLSKAANFAGFITRRVSEGPMCVFPGDGPSLTRRVMSPENFARKTRLGTFAMQSGCKAASAIAFRGSENCRRTESVMDHQAWIPAFRPLDSLGTYLRVRDIYFRQ